MTNERNERGMIAVSQALLLGPLPFVLMALVQDWYVDVNAPGCPTGTGTQADPFCDIMDAVAAAADGDTIHIAPGTYYENVLLDKDLSLIGTGGQAVTIIDGNASGSVVRVRNSAVALTGLTLTNGTGSAHMGFTRGGGLLAQYPSTITLQECRVSGNTADWGGGINLSDGGMLTLIDSTVTSNASAFGRSGIVTYNQRYTIYSAVLTLVNSAVYGNTCTSGPYAIGITSSNTTLTLDNSSVYNHSSTNIAFDENGSVTGGLAMTNSTVSDSQYGIWIFNEHATITNSTVSGCSGAGISVRGYFGASVLTLTNSTVTENQGVGVIVSTYYDPYSSASAIVENCILEDDRPLLLGANSSATVNYSFIRLGWPGVGNIGFGCCVPIFVDSDNGDFRLLPGSPCIDAGNNLAVPPDIWTDLDGKLRFIDDPLTPDTGHPGHLWPIVDMGAYEFGVEHPRKVRRR